MNTCLFLSFRFQNNPPVSAGEMAKLHGALRAAPMLLKALVHTPERASDPYLDDGLGPQLMLQLYFAELADLETALAADGHLAVLMSRDEFPALAHADVAQQAMLVRSFAVNEPTFKNAHEGCCCTYLVSYEGEAEDLNAWLRHYLGKHAEHMANLPSIRELEVYTRLDWVTWLPWPRVNFMQRNKVVFDSPDALTQALNSPVRHKMRECYRAFPRFTGPTTHYAMASRILHPDSGSAELGRPQPHQQSVDMTHDHLAGRIDE
jgi:hypothetical protein